jgi:Ca-activated chloride channel family protein
MNFENLNQLPWILLSALIFVGTVVWLEIKFFKLVKLYWFYKRSLLSYASSALFCLGMIGLLFSLLDLRGPEEKIKSGVPTERTIILIDTSASMLAEDVRPSRLQKSVLVAKHFARKAAGHQIAIVVFAEIQKKIVPFTNDIDLIDARLESIKNLRNQNGSSALSVAIQESIQYFKEAGDVRGNLLVITDGEETAEDLKLNIPKEIHLAIVGVGTTKGGRIPLDDGRGFRFGYKKNRGQDVVTKLNEGFFKKIVADVPSGEYWLTNSYSLPTDEILKFFRGEKTIGEKQQDMVVKPVLAEWIVIPAIILLILSYLFKSIRVFAFSFFLVFMPLRAEDNKSEKIEIPQEVLEKLERLQKGELNKLEKIKLADDLQKAGAKKEAISLYEENLPMGHARQGIPPEAYLNYGTALLEKGEAQKGLAVYDSLYSSLDPKDTNYETLKGSIEKNVMTFFKQQEQKEQKKKQQDKKDKEDKEKKEGSGESGKKENNKEGQSKSDPKGKNDKGDGEKQKNKDKDKGDEDKNDEGEEDKNDDKKNEESKSQPKDRGEQKKLPPQKLTPKLKQLMSDDRQLQMKIIEQGTKDMNRRQNRENKDW